MNFPPYALCVCNTRTKQALVGTHGGSRKVNHPAPIVAEGSALRGGWSTCFTEVPEPFLAGINENEKLKGDMVRKNKWSPSAENWWRHKCQAYSNKAEEWLDGRIRDTKTVRQVRIMNRVLRKASEQASDELAHGMLQGLDEALEEKTISGIELTDASVKQMKKFIT